MKVPFVDLEGQHSRIRAELDAALKAVVDESAFINGPRLTRFEAELARNLEVRHVRGVSSGTAALAIAMRALGIGPGDEVVTTVHSAVPTAEAVALTGATPVLTDVDPDTWLIDPDEVEAAITPRTRALLPVHLYGMPVRLDRLTEIAARHGLPLIEDCAQSAGARYRGRPVGSFGRVACHSFFPSKNLGGFGDGGAVATDDAAIAEFTAMYRDHGRRDKFVHERIGANERLDALQAAVLSVKLRHLDDWNARRRAVASWYHEDLEGVPELLLQGHTDGAEPVWHLFVVRVADRDDLAKHLAERGIGSGVHYPVPLSSQPAFADLRSRRASFPIAERVCSQVLSLPMDPFLTREQIRAVTDAVKQFCVGRRRP